MKLALTFDTGRGFSCASGLRVPAGERPRALLAVSDDLFSNRDRRLRTAELERCSEDISGWREGLRLASRSQLVGMQKVAGIGSMDVAGREGWFG